MSDDETIKVYDAKAAEYAAMTANDDPIGLLPGFVAALPVGAHVLDFGCGPGKHAAAMARAGLKVEAWDASAAMVALAQQHPGVRARQALFQDLAAEALYDGIWANFSLLHAPIAEFPTILSAVHRALKPAGQFHIALKEGTGEKRDRLGRRYSYFTQASLSELLQTAGFTHAPFVTGEGTGLDGRVAPWISTTAQA